MIHTCYPHVVLVRHAQSEWNREGRFTGWANPPLTAQGVAEARAAGRRLAAAGHRFDHGFSSRLGRARHTLDLILGEIGQPALPVNSDWRLNERHYGALQGRVREEEAGRVGADQVLRWRRGYADPPPLLPMDDPRHPAHEPLYADVPRCLLPRGESLAQTRARVAGFWREAVAPRPLLDLWLATHPADPETASGTKPRVRVDGTVRPREKRIDYMLLAATPGVRPLTMRRDFLASDLVVDGRPLGHLSDHAALSALIEWPRETGGEEGVRTSGRAPSIQAGGADGTLAAWDGGSDTRTRSGRRD